MRYGRTSKARAGGELNRGRPRPVWLGPTIALIASHLAISAILAAATGGREIGDDAPHLLDLVRAPFSLFGDYRAAGYSDTWGSFPPLLPPALRAAGPALARPGLRFLGDPARRALLEHPRPAGIPLAGVRRPGSSKAPAIRAHCGSSRSLRPCSRRAPSSPRRRPTSVCSECCSSRQRARSAGICCRWLSP